jgi:hypothetical protein
MNTIPITEALEYYDMNSEKYVVKNVRYIRYDHSKSDTEHNSIIMYDKNKNEIFRSRYEVIGIHEQKTNIWAWAWSIPTLIKNSTMIIKKILLYGLDLDIENRILKTELITSRFKVSNNIQLEIQLAIASYLSKIPLIFSVFSYSSTNNNNDYIDLLIDDNQIKTKVYLFLLDYKQFEI